MRPNISIGINSIFGNLIIIGKDNKNFKSLSSEEIIFLFEELIQNSFNEKKFGNNFKPNYKSFHNTKNFKNNNFEESLIEILKNIELTLASILKNNFGG